MEIEISDHGKGIEDIELARKPLYTSKPNLERSGMGFTIMENFMDEMQIDYLVKVVYFIASVFESFDNAIDESWIILD